MSKNRDLPCSAGGERLDDFHSQRVCRKDGGMLQRYDVLLCESGESATVSTRSELKRPESSENRTARAPKPLPKSHSLGGIIQPY